MTPAAMLEPNTELAMAFLTSLDGEGRHDLFAIHPDLKERQTGKTEASTFLPDERADMRDWISKEQGRRNIYYTVNQAKDFESLEQRLKKSDIGQIRAIVVDVDAAPPMEHGGDSTVEHFSKERERLIRLAKDMHADQECPPTIIVDTGGGIQALWKLNPPLPATVDNIALVEGIGRTLKEKYGGDSVFDVARIMRLPGTINVLSPKKREQGRVPALVTVMVEQCSGKTFTIEQLQKWAPPTAAKTSPNGTVKGPPIDMAVVEAADTYEELPAGLRQKFEAYCMQRPEVGALWEGTPAPWQEDPSASGYEFALAHALRLSGRFTITEYAQLVAVWEYRSVKHADDFERRVSRSWTRSRVPLGAAGFSNPTTQSAAEEWGEPADLWSSRSAPADLPAGVVPEIIEGVARDQARRLGVDPGGPAAASITAIGSLVPAGNRLQMRQHDPDWKVKPVLWMALVGEPGTNKTGVLGYATAPIDVVESRWAKQYALDRRKFDAQRTTAARTKPKTDASAGALATAPIVAADMPASLDVLWPEVIEEPTLQRKLVRDATTEQLAVILSKNPDGLLLYSDELSGHFGSMDVYHQRAGKDRPFWLQAKEGGRYTVDRRTSDAVSVENLAIGVLGGIQPEKIKSLSSGLSDDGMLQRFIPIILKRTGPGEDTPAAPNLREAVNRLAFDLVDSERAGLFRFSPAADQEFRTLQAFAAHEAGLPNASPALRQWLDKLPNEFGRLALVFHFIEWHSSALGQLTGLAPPALVSVETARRARRFLTEFVYSHAIAFHEQVLGVSEADEHARWIAGLILSRGMATIDERTIYRSYLALRPKEKRGGITEAMRVLEMQGWAQPIKERRGKPTAWSINPEVHEMFAARADEERSRRLAAHSSIQWEAERRRANPGEDGFVTPCH
jgi:hypothetical protein